MNPEAVYREFLASSVGQQSRKTTALLFLFLRKSLVNNSTDTRIENNKQKSNKGKNTNTTYTKDQSVKHRKCEVRSNFHK